jgi:DNA (cytosine-5)-methyltransferase 1
MTDFKIQPVVTAWSIGKCLSSPSSCRHHSKAKGGKPVSRSVRGLADVILLWAQEVKPQIILLEKVEEFRDWGPLGADGMPIKEQKGREFIMWLNHGRAALEPRDER